MMNVDLVCFDLDGTLIETEEVWADVRRAYVAEHGGVWHAQAQRAMMGMNTSEWSHYLHGLGVDRTIDQIAHEIARGVLDRYRQGLPFIPGALDAVRRIAARWPLALVTGSPRVLIDAFLDASGLRATFAWTVSADDVPRGKPAPDAYLRAAQLAGVEPAACVAIEDSGSGIRSAAEAGFGVVAIPSRDFPPAPDDLARAHIRLASIGELDATVIERARSSMAPR